MAACGGHQGETVREQVHKELQRFSTDVLRGELAALGAQVRLDLHEAVGEVCSELRDAIDRATQRRAWPTPNSGLGDALPGRVAATVPTSPNSRDGGRSESIEVVRHHSLSPSKLRARAEQRVVEDQDLESGGDRMHEWAHRHPKNYTAGEESAAHKLRKWWRRDGRMRSAASDPGAIAAGPLVSTPSAAQLVAGTKHSHCFGRNPEAHPAAPRLLGAQPLPRPPDVAASCAGVDTASDASARLSTTVPGVCSDAHLEESPGVGLDSKKSSAVYVSDMSSDGEGAGRGGSSNAMQKAAAAKARLFAAHSDSRSLRAFWSKEFSCVDKVQIFVLSVQFDYLTGILVILNAITLGVQTDYMARHTDMDVPMPFRVLELLFCFLFTAEIALRCYVLRGQLFRSREWKWNLFDCLLVGVQLGEELLTVSLRAANKSVAVASHFTVMRVLRLLRLVRIIRLLRIMRLIGELRMLVMSILGSMKSLCWAVVLLFLMIYIVGVYFTQLVSDHRSMLASRGEADRVSPELLQYYSSLGRTILSLYEAVTGGVDWDVVVVPLMNEISPWVAVVFSLYIAFAMLAMMNVVTGVFMETALLSAKKDRDIYMVNHVRELFNALDLGNTGMLTWGEIESHMNTKELQEYFRAIDVDMSEARGLFKLLDLNDNGVINAEDFLNGCIRIRGPARALETMLLLRETTRLADRHAAHARRVEGLLASHPPGVAPAPSSDSRRTSPCNSPSGAMAPVPRFTRPLSGMGRPPRPPDTRGPAMRQAPPQAPSEEPKALSALAHPQRPAAWRFTTAPQRELLRRASCAMWSPRDER